MVAGVEQVRVMIVSAAPYTRYVISGELSSEPDVFVVGTAQTTDEISDRRALLRPDVVIVDVESPRDLAKIQQILQETKLPVLALCSESVSSPGLADAALEAGADDVVARSDSDNGKVLFVPDLSPRVRALAHKDPGSGG